MKTLPVVVLAALSVALAGFAEAAPKKRTRNANRIGPYGMGFVGQSSFTNDHSADEQDLRDSFEDAGGTDVQVKTEDTDIGYNATFGYRFNRYLAAELGLVQLGSLSIQAQGNIAQGAGGTVPASLKLDFAVGGAMISAIAILPVNEKFEVYGRLGYMFTSSEIEFSSRIDGDLSGFGTAKGDSQDMVLGVGAAWHFNQVYSARLEYQQLEGIGEAGATGEQDLNVIGLGVVVRF